MRSVKVWRNELVRCLTVVAAVLFASTSGAAVPGEATASQPEAGADRGPFRQLAPGVERTITVERQADELFSRHDIPELLSVDEQFDWAREVRFEHDIWNLEFTFKPVRFITVELPDGEGNLQPRLVWYMVYRVRNVSDQPVNFVPYFVLESREAEAFYPDRLIPLAVPAIQQREDARRTLADSVAISGPIPPAGADTEASVWGVVTWTDVDPRTDHFSIYVSGLTNAYRWQDTPEGTREFTRKTLKLNFWRPGDEFDEHETEIRMGGPDEVDYRWVYR